MTTPIDPSQSSPIQPNMPQQSRSYVDPTGTWAKFLGGSGMAATPKDVQMFMQGILKMFNVLLQQQNDAAKRAADALKKAETGEE